MRHKVLLLLVLGTALVAGCKSVDDWNGLQRGKAATAGPSLDDGQLVAGYLDLLARLGRGGAAEQAEILESTRNAYLTQATTQNRLRYAFVLGVPGHAASDPEGSRRLLGEALATPETLLPSERALAELIVRDVDTRLALSQENAALRNGSGPGERDRVAALSRRLQQETAEKDRLRRELEEARAKLEAIAALEGGPTERKP